MQRAHIPFRVVDNFEEIDNLKILVLPNCACLSSEECALLEKYVQNGGKLIVSFETSLYSQVNRLDDFALSNLLGIHYQGIEEYGTFENYFQVGEQFFPAYTYVMKVQPETAEVMGYISENTKGYYQPIIMSSFPAICKNKFGAGKVYYFCGNFFQTYFDYKFPKYLSLFQKIFDSEVERQIILENTPESVEVTLRKKGDTLLIHLINFTSGLKRPIENLIPVEGIVLKIPGVNPISVTCLLGQTSPKWQRKDGFVEINVPRLHEYEVIAVK
ncbi:MAG TPA: hypothetical protein ENG51_01000 [Deltaproteobacteria bacterium]|nr:hypothetical protein [Deltaproteobacteria bacterium]